MATQTILEAPVVPTITTDVVYPDPEWSHTTLNYYKDAVAPPPDQLNSKLTEHELRQARRSDDGPNVAKTPVRIRNIAGRESEYSINTHGFCISHLDSKMQEWRNDSELKRIYFPEITSLLKRETGAKHVFQYEWHVRTDTLESALRTDSRGATDINGPVRRVHIDESPKSAHREFAYHVLSNKPGMQGREFGIFNVWKPLKTVRRDPLCLCDVRTIEDQDLQLGKVQVPLVGEIENFAIRAPGRGGREEGEGKSWEDGRKEHGFVYVREQKPEQALVFRIFDSRVDVEGANKRCYGVAHSSFVDPGTEMLDPRESVEVRSFCVF